MEWFDHIVKYYVFMLVSMFFYGVVCGKNIALMCFLCNQNIVANHVFDINQNYETTKQVGQEIKHGGARGKDVYNGLSVGNNQQENSITEC